MNSDLFSLGRFVLGVSLIGGLYCWIKRWRAQPRPLSAVGPLLESRLHYALVGTIAGYTAFPDLQRLFSDSAILAMAFFGGWYGLIIGLGLDQRILRRSSLPLMALEAGLAVLVAVGVLLATPIASRLLGPGRLPFRGASLLVLGGIGAVGAPLRRCLVGESRKKQKGWGWEPSVAAWIGVGLIGLGSMQLRHPTFAILLPFAPPHKELLVEGLAAASISAMALGAIIGIILDLVTRGADWGDLFYLTLGGLVLGSGLAAGLGLEPLWVGAIAGAWLINATLFRLGLFEVADRSYSVMRIGLFFTAGWLLGQGIFQSGIDLVVGGWVFAVVALFRPAAVLAEKQVIRYLADIALLKRVRERGWFGAGQEELALLAASGLMAGWEGPVGTGVLAGTLAGIWALRLSGDRPLGATLQTAKK